MRVCRRDEKERLAHKKTYDWALFLSKKQINVWGG